MNFSNSLADIERGITGLGELVHKYLDLAAIVPQSQPVICDRAARINLQPCASTKEMAESPCI